MGKAKRDSILGMVFFAGLALLITATITLSDLSLKPGAEVVVYFENAQGLKVGDPVQLLGTPAGQVTNVAIEPNRKNDKVKVALRLNDQLSLKSDATFQILDANFLGGKVIEINPGLANEPKAPNKLLSGQSDGNAFDRIADMIAGGNNAEELAGALAGINKFFETLNEADGSVQKLLKSDELYNQVSKFLASLQKSAEALEKGNGVAARLLHDEKLANNVDSIVANFEKTMAKVASGEGALGRIIHNDKLATDLSKIADDLAQLTGDVRDGKGALGMLISDEKFKERVAGIGKNLDETLAKLNDPKAGLLGALMGDETMLADGRQILADLAAVTTELRSGDGALAKLINDKEMGRQLERVLNQVSRAVEDAREAAPIGTIFQVFAGAF